MKRKSKNTAKKPLDFVGIFTCDCNCVNVCVCVCVCVCVTYACVDYSYVILCLCVDVQTQRVVLTGFVGVSYFCYIILFLCV